MVSNRRRLVRSRLLLRLLFPLRLPLCFSSSHSSFLSRRLVRRLHAKFRPRVVRRRRHRHRLVSSTSRRRRRRTHDSIRLDSIVSAVSADASDTNLSLSLRRQRNRRDRRCVFLTPSCASRTARAVGRGVTRARGIRWRISSSGRGTQTHTNE